MLVGQGSTGAERQGWTQLPGPWFSLVRVDNGFKNLLTAVSESSLVLGQLWWRALAGVHFTVLGGGTETPHNFPCGPEQTV